jgi:hypothetical protein
MSGYNLVKAQLENKGDRFTNKKKRKDYRKMDLKIKAERAINSKKREK